MKSLHYHFTLTCFAAIATQCAAQSLESAQPQSNASRAVYTTEPVTDVATLTKNLQDADPNVRWRAARSLGSLGGRAKSAEPMLVKLLDDSEPVVQVYATVAVSRLGIRSEDAIAGLSRCVQSSDPRVVRTAILTLGKMELAPEQLATAMSKLFATQDPTMLVYAVDAIADSGERATPLLQAALKEGDDAAYWASIAIAEIGPAAAGTVPELTAVLPTVEDPETRARILMALAKIGPAAKEAAPAIAEILKQNPDPTAALLGAYALGAIGATSDSAVLEPLAAQKEEPLAMVAAWALTKTDTQQSETWRERAIEKMLAGLSSDNPLVRTTAAKGLLDLKPTGENVNARLMEAIQDPDPEVAANIIEALASLGPSIVPGIAKSLDNPRLQPLLINVLGRIGPDSKAAVPQLTALLPNANDELKARIHFVLAGVGPDATPATMAIAQSLNHQEPRVRQSALFALRQIGPGAVDALPQLAAMLDSSEGIDQLATAWAIARIAPANESLHPKVAQVLHKGLTDDHPATRYETAAAIAKLGSMADAFQEELMRVAKNDPDEQVRVVAAKAVQEIAK